MVRVETGTEATPGPGDVIDGKFVLRTELGSGAFGVVWAANALDSGESVALKLLSSSGVSAQRFEREAHAVARISHPHIVEFLGAGPAPGGHYLAMELAGGRPLRESLHRQRSVAEVLAIVTQTCAALRAAHEVGVAHRDLKPDNIMVESSSSGERVKVVDFGLAKLHGRDQVDVTATGEVFGTPLYMSPEQLRGSRDAGPPADVYALGVIAFELLEGTPPFSGASMVALAMAHMQMKAPRVTRPDVPIWFADLIAQMLHKQPEARPSAAQVLRVLQGSRDSSVPLSAVAAVLGAVVLALAAVLIVPLWRADNPPARPEPSGTPVHTPPPPARAPEQPPEITPKTETPTEPSACLPTGHGLRTRTVGSWALDARRVLSYIPKDLDPTVVPDIIVALSGGGRDGKEFVATTEVTKIADGRNYVVLVPDSQVLAERHWESEGALEAALQDVEATRAEWCLKSSRVFLFSSSAGGRAAHKLRCGGVMEVAAVAAYDFLYRGEQPWCDADPAPYLELMPQSSAPECRGAELLTQMRATREERHRCGGEEEVRADWTSPSARCVEKRCEVPIINCDIYERNGWIVPTDYHKSKCRNEIPHGAAFPYHDVVADFFEQYRD